MEDGIVMSQGTNNTTEVRPFSIKDKMGYLFGDFGNDFTFIFASSYLMVFYTKVLGISGAVVGILFMASRCVDAFTDVTMGRIVDTVKPARDGRFRPWIRRMCIPVAVASALMYLYFIKDFPYAVRIVYMCVTYLLWGSICYTGINIPYGSMASVITDNAKDRASLSTFRSIGATLAGLAIGMIAPLIVYTSDSEGNQIVIPERFTIVAVIFGICAVICYVLCYNLCVERVKVESQAKEKNDSNIGKMLTGLFSNRALLAIIGAALLLLLASLLSQSMNAYLYMDYFKNAKILTVVTFTGIGGSLLVAPFVAKISERFGKKEAGSIGVLVASLVYFLVFFMRIKNVWVYLILTFVGMLGMGFFNLIIWAFITDVIDYQEVRTHKREDGTVYAVYSFARKLGQALAGGIGGFALSAIGYVSEATSQTQEVANGIYTVSTLVPAVCYFGVFAIMFFAYPLSKKAVLENTAELKRRREGKK